MSQYTCIYDYAYLSKSEINMIWFRVCEYVVLKRIRNKYVSKNYHNNGYKRIKIRMHMVLKRAKINMYSSKTYIVIFIKVCTKEREAADTISK